MRLDVCLKDYGFRDLGRIMIHVRLLHGESPGYPVALYLE